MGYKDGGDEGAIAGEKSSEWMKQRSSERIEERSVS
jgi:hypothetical protein